MRLNGACPWRTHLAPKCTQFTTLTAFTTGTAMLDQMGVMYFSGLGVNSYSVIHMGFGSGTSLHSYSVAYEPAWALIRYELYTKSDVNISATRMVPHHAAHASSSNAAPTRALANATAGLAAAEQPLSADTRAGAAVMGAGAGAGAINGAGTGVGAGPGAGAGTVTGAGPGTGTARGPAAGAGAGTRKGVRSGAGTGAGTGASTGAGTGTGASTGAGTGSGRGTVFDAGAGTPVAACDTVTHMLSMNIA